MFERKSEISLLRSLLPNLILITIGGLAIFRFYSMQSVTDPELLARVEQVFPEGASFLSPEESRWTRSEEEANRLNEKAGVKNSPSEKNQLLQPQVLSVSISQPLWSWKIDQPIGIQVSFRAMESKDGSDTPPQLGKAQTVYFIGRRSLGDGYSIDGTTRAATYYLHYLYPLIVYND